MTAERVLFLLILLLAGLQDLRSRRVSLAWPLLLVGAFIGAREDPVRTLMSAMALAPGFGPVPAPFYLLFFVHPASFLLLPAARRTARGEMGLGDLMVLAAIGMAFPWPGLLFGTLALEAYRRLRPADPEAMLPGIPALAFGAAMAGIPGPALSPGFPIWLAGLPLLLSAARFGRMARAEGVRLVGRFGGLPFHAGTLTLLAGAPGAGKTSWALRIAAEASERIPAAFACYEHTPEELALRLERMAACLGVDPGRWGQLLLLELSDREDTPRALEEQLLEEGFPARGEAFLAVDYLQRAPVYGHDGLLSEARRGGEAAAALRAIARRRGWTILAISAVRREAFGGPGDLAALLGDERIAYEADRILYLREGAAEVLKDRMGPLRTIPLRFDGAHFAMEAADPWDSKAS